VYRERSGAEAAKRFELIENGFEEGSFAEVEGSQSLREPLAPGRITLLHSGIVYPQERDPAALFKALGSLRRKGELRPENIGIRFRAPVHQEMLKALAISNGVEDLIDVAPPIPYKDVLAEM